MVIFSEIIFDLCFIQNMNRNSNGPIYIYLYVYDHVRGWFNNSIFKVYVSMSKVDSILIGKMKIMSF